MELYERYSYMDYLCRGMGQIRSRKLVVDKTGCFRLPNDVIKQCIADAESVDKTLYDALWYKTYYDESAIRELFSEILNVPRQKFLLLLGYPKTFTWRMFENVMIVSGFNDILKEYVDMYNQNVADKIVETNLNKYGCPCVFQSELIKDKIRLSVQAVYGVDNPSQVETVKKKRLMSQSVYGTDCVLSASEVRDKARNTIRKLYGVDNVSQSDIIKQKKADTCMQHFGVKINFMLDSQRQQTLDAVKRIYGLSDDEVGDAKYPFQIPRFLEICGDICEQSIGVSNPFDSKIVQDSIKKTVFERYGVMNPIQSAEIREKIYKTKLEHGTSNTSSVEDAVYDGLVNIYGTDDVCRQYKCERYPFPCDFYITSRDMFIEVNGSWVHGGKWYSGSSEDVSLLEAWRSKKTEYYNKAIATWSERDVKKRICAKNHCLNYVVFWDGMNTNDFMLWLSIGCPDGHDYDCEYSWLIDNESLKA